MTFAIRSGYFALTLLCLGMGGVSASTGELYGYGLVALSACFFAPTWKHNRHSDAKTVAE